MDPTDPTPQSARPAAASHRHAALGELRAVAKACNAVQAWDLLVQASRLHTDAGAAFVMVESLASAFELGRACHAGPAPNRNAVAQMLQALRAHCLAQDFERRLGNRFGHTSHLSGPIGDNWLLAALVTPPLGEFAARVAALHYLVALSLLDGQPQIEAARRVANVARMSRSIITWSTLMRELPDPAALPSEWPQQFAAWALDRLSDRTGREDPLAIVSFCRALLALLQLTQRDIEAPKSQPSLLPEAPGDLDSVGDIRVVSQPERRIGPRAARRERHDDDELQQPPLALFCEADEQRPGGLEPATLALHVRDEVLRGEHAATPAAQAQETRLASYQFADIEQVLRWSWDHLNPPELRLVVKALRRQLCAPPMQSPAALLVATVLATGAPVEEVVQIAISTAPGQPGIDPCGRWTRMVPCPGQAWAPGADAIAVLQPHAKTLTVELEGFIASAWSDLLAARPGSRTVGQALGLSAEQAPDRLSEWLQPLRLEAPWARLTRGRIWRALQVELSAVIANDAAMHFIVGKARDVAPTSSYYTAVPVDRLESAYRRASANLFCLALPTRPAVEAAHSESPVFVGSRKTPSLSWLRDQVRALTEAVHGSSPQNVVATHNHFTAHVLWLLMFATGHRPVAHPVESLDVIDIDGGWLSISDKSVRRPGEARMVPLCSLASAAVSAYVDHLGRLAALVHGRDEALCRDILSVTAARGPRALPLFFLLDDTFGTRFISAAELAAMAPGLAPLQANLARHLLSSGEAALGPMADLVREMLGHVQHAQPVLGPQSPMSCEDYGPLRDWLDTYLRNLGWQALSSPLPAAPRSWVRPTQAARGIRLGAEQRRCAAEQALRRSSQALHNLLHTMLSRKPLSAISQQDVDAIFSGLLSGRKAPTKVIELEASRRAYRLLSWCQQRYGLDIRLPKVYLPASSAPPAFDSGSLVRAKAARELPAEMDRVLAARARDLRHHHVAPGRQVAEATVSLVVHSRIADVERVDGFFDGRDFDLLSDAAGGAWLVFSDASATREGQPMHWRHAVHPATAALVARLRTRLRANTESDRDAPGRHKQLVALVEHLRACVEPGATPFATAGAAIRWLCDRTAALNALELPGTVAGYLDGSTGGTSLPPGDWARLVHGRPLRRDAIQPNEAAIVKRGDVITAVEAEEASADEPEGDTSIEWSTPAAVTVPLPALPPCRDDPTPGVALARARSMHNQVNSLIQQQVRGLGSGRTRANQALSRNQKETLLPALSDLCRRFDDVPVLARACVQWLEHLLLHGIGGKELRTRSCVRYYYALAPRLPLALAALDVADLGTDSLALAYGEFIDLLGPASQAYAFRRLQAFHHFLMAHHGVPPIEWAEVAPTTLLPSLRVDASIVTWPEHQAVLELLAADPHADERTRVLQTVVWLFVFRFGARVSEVLGLRRKDVVSNDGELVLLFRPNAYRDLKSHAGIRQVPLIGPLSALESDMLERWLEHVDHYASVDRMAALFGERGQARELVDTRAITARITQALHGVTGDAHLRIHSGRHAFACRLQLLMHLDEVREGERFGVLISQVLGPIEPAEARRLLTNTPQRSRRGLWAAKLAMGHASPLTMQRCYCHLDDLLAARVLEPIFQRQASRMNRRTLAYVTGCGDAAIPQAVNHSAQPISLARVMNMLPQAWSRSARLVVERAQPARLPPRATPVARPLTPALADQALGLVHRRGELDGAHLTLMLPAPQLRDLFVAEHTVREASGYDVQGARWPATSASMTLKHARTGQRSPSETARVQPFLAGLESKLRDDAFAAATRQVCGLWMARFRHDCTPLVLASAREAVVFVSWLHEAGLPASALQLRLSNQDQSDELAGLLEAPRLPEIAHGTVPSPRSRLRRSATPGIGLLLKENRTEPLTQMSQLHRVMHVLGAVLGASG